MGMNRTFKAAVAALMLAVGFAGSVTAGPFEDAVAAYNKGDYATALRLIRPLAEQGDARAQTMLGDMYDNGQGIPQDMKPDVQYTAAVGWYSKAAEQGDADAQRSLARTQNMLGSLYNLGVPGVRQDYAAAASWYRKAAEQGYAEAQASLGVLYLYGRGVPQDNVLAHMWFNVAAVSGNKDVKDVMEFRDIVAAKMTPVQIAEAQKLAREWKPK
jgi:uncharacterized protein